ncbi:MAG: hypothetical protein EAX90_11010, partial [Candidatus Heimdallarchaeota archaeon]|nr:hypothetical protein [Candidatus Heimdallarchaeota archaeon]
GTDPTKEDSDSDGLSDGEEVNTHNTNPLDEDTDGDGFDDAEEIAAGTDPTDPDEYPVTETPIETITPTGSGRFIGRLVSLTIVTSIALVIISLIERRKKYFS